MLYLLLNELLLQYQYLLVIEYLLLHELLAQPGRVLTRDRLQQVLYGWDEEAESNALEVHIHHLRKKLFPELIRTVRGVGYLVDKA
mgnify:CR=1 FL=1